MPQQEKAVPDEGSCCLTGGMSRGKPFFLQWQNREWRHWKWKQPNGKCSRKGSAFVYSPVKLSGSLAFRNSCFLNPFSQWAMDTLEKCPLKWAMGPLLAIPQSQVGENSLLTAKGCLCSIMNLSAVLKKSHVLLPFPNKWLLQSLINFSPLFFCGKVSPWPGDKLCLFLYLGELWPVR